MMKTGNFCTDAKTLSTEKTFTFLSMFRNPQIFEGLQYNGFSQAYNPAPVIGTICS
jgi:hypothetical protein